MLQTTCVAATLRLKLKPNSIRNSHLLNHHLYDNYITAVFYKSRFTSATTITTNTAYSGWVLCDKRFRSTKLVSLSEMYPALFQAHYCPRKLFFFIFLLSCCSYRTDSIFILVSSSSLSSFSRLSHVKVLLKFFTLLLDPLGVS